MKVLLYGGWACPPSAYEPLATACGCVVHDWGFFRPGPLLRPSPTAEEHLIIAHSLGCLAALQQAASPGSSCRGLILCSPFASFCGGDRTRQTTLKAMRRQCQPGREAAMLAEFHAACATPHKPAILSQGEGHAPALAEGLDLLRDTNVADLAAGLRSIPVSILIGAADTIVPPAMSLDLAALLPEALCIEMAGIGHDLPWRQPERLLHIVHQHMRDLQ